MAEPRRLLILACSARKRAVSGPVTAWDLYDGVVFRMLKQLQRTGLFPPDVDCLILSARYGLIPPTALIVSYDQKLTLAAARRQASHHCARLRALLTVHPYREIFLCLGRAYLAALHPLTAWQPPATRLWIAPGGLGQKIRALRAWLLADPTKN